MHCVTVTYRVQDMSDEQLGQVFEAAVPAIGSVPGLGMKIWLAGAGGTFGGVYVFESEEAADAYLASPFYAEAVRDNPHFVDLEERRHRVLEAPTAATSPWVRLPAGAVTA
jgi:quinol monooxygenase YgiN